MQKAGQLQISFGMIFSIIIIIATLAVAGYVIVNFVDLGGNISCKLLYQDLQEKIDKAWHSSISSESFNKDVPAGINYVCFGNLSQQTNSSYKMQYEKFSMYARPKSNMFFYPVEGACDDTEFTYALEHVSFPGFFCIPVKEGKIGIHLSKGKFDSLVRLTGK